MDLSGGALPYIMGATLELEDRSFLYAVSDCPAHPLLGASAHRRDPLVVQAGGTTDPEAGVPVKLSHRHSIPASLLSGTRRKF